MWDFFTRKDDNGKVQRVYYLENCDDLFCKTLPTFNTFVYGAAWRDRDNCVYRLKKTKGYYLLDKFAYFLSYRLIEFNIIKEDEEKNTAEVIGKVSFPKRQCIDFRINDDRFYVGYQEQGYYSIKRNGIQVALFLLEPYSNGGRNRYCVWYEPECCEYLGFLIFFMTMTDYMLNTNRTNTGRTTWTIYYKKADSEEIKWRPSDTDEAMLKKEEKYVEKIAKQEKTGQRMGILLLIYLVIFFLIFFAFRSIS